MAETDPVKIVVDVISNVEDDVAEIKSQLEVLRDDIEAKFDVTDGGDIEELLAELQTLQQKLEAELDVDVEDVAQSEATLDALARDRTVTINTVMSGEFTERIHRAVAGVTPGVEMRDIGAGGPGVHGGIGEFMEGMPQRSMFPGRGAVPRIKGIDDFDLPDADLGDRISNLNRKWDEFGKTLLEFKPSIMDWWNILALLIPIMITLAGAAIGLAAALVALGGAAATLIGVGLLGWGDNLQETFQNLKKDLTTLADTLHGVLQPAAVSFRPIIEDFLDAIPPAVEALVGPMKQAALFADTIAAAGSGFIDWLTDAINIASNLQGAIHRISMAVGEAFGSFLLQVLRTMVKEVDRNIESYMKLADIFVDFFVILFNLSKAITFAVAQFGFLLEIAKALSAVLSNRFMVTLLSLATFTFLAVGAFTKLIAAFRILSAVAMADVLFSLGLLKAEIQILISQTWAWIAAVETLRGAFIRLLAATGVGVALAGAGLIAGEALATMGGASPGGGGGGGRPTGGTVINIEGSVEKKQMDRLIDKMPREARKEHKTLNSMEGR